MATNGTNMSEDAEMAECDGEKVVTMMDVLQEQQDFEEDANAVLGASDDKNCTYSKGYVKRQAIYACLTCCPEAAVDPTKRAGVCLACSLACHENHELVELYTKRNFRCDCGNPKFTQTCQFTPNKTDLNYENKYNQNFSGLYCNCKRPYPDPESNEEEEMIQCIVCEDWLHTNHLEATIPSNDQYAEMICKACMEDIDFLHDYSDLVVNVEDKEITVMDPDLDVTSISKAKEIINKDQVSTDTAEAETCKEKNETVSDNIDGNVDENKNDEKSTDVESQVKSEPDQSGDGNDVSKEKTTIVELNTETEASGDANPKTITNESSKELETDIKESTEPETESGEITSEQNVETEKKSIDSPIKAETNTIDQTTEVEKTDNANDENKESSETSKIETAVSNTEADSVTDTKVDEAVTTTDDIPLDIDESQKNEIKEDSSNATSDKENEMPTDKQEHKRKLSVEDNDVSPKKPKLETKPCTRPRGVKRVYKGATFWPHNLRQKLCTCTECLAMYKDLAVLFLTDPEDTVTAYEALGKESIDGATSSQYEKGLQALSSLDRVQQINAMIEYNKMRDKLLDFLKSFKDRKEIVKEEDIKAFFAGMKPKREPDGVYFCR